ncbi:hypothetical protein [Streptomyces sp. AJS327]|uniref:hypothetical protein n=1 Tax=Streptomyces sp. AJS327 TaxID=2545265 RepID=UPI0015DF89FC|nr:hypothetical protein [Streptomyces sp. AJS327]
MSRTPSGIRASGRPAAVRGAVSLVAALCALALAAPAAAAAEPRPYRAADDAKDVTGAASSADAPELSPGSHTDSVRPGEEKFYAVTLDDTSTAYFAATAAPKPGSPVRSYRDEIEVSLETTGGDSCGDSDAEIRGDLASPLTAWAVRTIGRGSDEDCQAAGPYLLRVERSNGSGGGAWPLEISYMREPGLKGGGSESPSDGPTSTPSHRPSTPTGEPKDASGGDGFASAGAIGDGVWKDRVRPGETRFYKVPVDWGQRLLGGLELPNPEVRADDSRMDYTSSAFHLELFNTARGPVVRRSAQTYRAKFDRTELTSKPVRYESRFAQGSTNMRVAGWQYLVVTLSPELDKYFPEEVPILLRVAVDGEPVEGPEYDGDAAEAGFGVTDRDREMAAKGQTEADASRSDGLRRFGYLGIGVGSLLVVGLGVWTVIARRRPATPAGPFPVPHGAPGGYPAPGSPFGPSVPDPSVPGQASPGRTSQGTPPTGPGPRASQPPSGPQPPA